MIQFSFKKRSRWWEVIGEKFIAANALLAVVAIALIFIFIFREAWPVFSDPEVRSHVTPERIFQAQRSTPDQPAVHAWRPTSANPHWSFWPLIVGSLKAAVVALLLAVPLSIGAAIYTAQFASPRARELIKPTIELLAGIPSVVLGFFALIVLADLVQAVFGFTFRLNATTAGIALGLAVIPIVFTIAENAMRAVPQSLREAALALGASPWQVTVRLVIPTALPGILAGVLLGFGRAVGETMIVLMASGNAAVLSANLGDSVRTMSATIALEISDVVFGGAHYSVLFLIGAMLFLFTFVVNLSGDFVLARLRDRIEGKAV